MQFPVEVRLQREPVAYCHNDTASVDGGLGYLSQSVDMHWSREGIFNNMKSLSGVNASVPHCHEASQYDAFQCKLHTGRRTEGA